MNDVTQTKPEETTPADEFASVFAGLDQLGDKPVPADLSKLGEATTDEAKPAEGNEGGKAPAVSSGEGDAAAAAAGAEGNGDGQQKPAAEGAASGDAPSGEQPAAAEKPAETPKPDAVERLADLLTQRAEQKPAAPQQEQRQQELPQHFSEEEQTFLAQYEQDFPDVARAETLRRRADMRDLAQYIFTQMFAQIGPLREVVEELTTNQHLGELHQVAPDYDDVREKVIDWVKTQPPVLRNAYEHVIKEGSVEDISFLISEYKKATGTQQQANTPAAKPEPKKETELPAATKQAVASLAPVSSKRSAISAGGVSSDDFEGSFAAWADKV